MSCNLCKEEVNGSIAIYKTKLQWDGTGEDYYISSSESLFGGQTELRWKFTDTEYAYMHYQPEGKAGRINGPFFCKSCVIEWVRVGKVIPKGVCNHCWKCKRKFTDYWDIVSRIRVDRDDYSSTLPPWHYRDRGGDKRYLVSAAHQEELNKIQAEDNQWICVECLTHKQFDEFLEPYFPLVLCAIINAYVGPVELGDQDGQGDQDDDHYNIDCF